MTSKVAAMKERREKESAAAGGLPKATTEKAAGSAGALSVSSSASGSAVSGSTKVAVKSAYKNIVKGKLALKGKPAPTIDKAKKKKAKAMASLADDFKAFLAANPNVDSADAKETFDKLAADDDASTAAATETTTAAAAPTAAAAAPDRRTKAERDFQRAQDAREAELVKAKIQKTHRQRIEEFNQMLANLSEHHDIPRVGPG